jgi:hypothetical protein
MDGPQFRHSFFEEELGCFQVLAMAIKLKGTLMYRFLRDANLYFSEIDEQKMNPTVGPLLSSFSGFKWPVKIFSRVAAPLGVPNV